jgi:hypothetical protein
MNIGSVGQGAGRHSYRSLSNRSRTKLTDKELEKKIKAKLEELPPIKEHTKNPSKSKRKKHQDGQAEKLGHRNRKAERSLEGSLVQGQCFCQGTVTIARF